MYEQPKAQRLIMLPMRIGRQDEESFIVKENISDHRADDGEDDISHAQPHRLRRRAVEHGYPSRSTRPQHTPMRVACMRSRPRPLRLPRNRCGVDTSPARGGGKEKCADRVSSP